MCDPISKILGFGFTIGFGFALVSFIVAHIAGRETPTIRKSILIIGLLLILIFVQPLDITPILSLIFALLLCSLILTSLIQTIQGLGITFYNTQISNEKVKYVSRSIFAIIALLAIILGLLGSISLIHFAYSLTKQITIFALGVWIALRLLWKTPN